MNGKTLKSKSSSGTKIGPRGGVYHLSSAGKRVSGPASAISKRVQYAAKVGDEVLKKNMNRYAQADHVARAFAKRGNKYYASKDELNDAIDQHINRALDHVRSKRHGNAPNEAMKKAGLKTYADAEAARAMVYGWLIDSHDRSNINRSIEHTQAVANLRVGALAKMGMTRADAEQLSQRGMTDPRYALGASIFADYNAHIAHGLSELSQKGLPEKLILYRGVNAQELRNGVLNTDHVTSFTTDPKVARKFGNLVVKVEVPRSSVVFHHAVVDEMDFHDPHVKSLSNEEKEVIVTTPGSVKALRAR